MNGNNMTGKFLSYVLRHKPEAIGIELDGHGWADVKELIERVSSTGRTLDMALLEEIVATDSKRRFLFNEDNSKIRANQGHSIDVDMEFKETLPPDILYHGTAEKYLDSIKQKGIEKRSRQFVHLSLNEQTATAVGARHGKPIVLKIDCKKMSEDGYKFFISENGVWLTDNVPIKYLINL